MALKVLKIAQAFRRVQFENFQIHENLLIMNCTRRSPDFLFIVYSTKFRSANQNAVTVSFVYISSDPFVFTLETFETLRSSVGNLRKTSVEPRTPSEFFGSTSEIFGRLRVNFGNVRKSAEVFGCFMVAFRSLLISENFVSTSERKVIGTPGEYNLGLIVLLSSNQNPVILLSVL